MTSVSQSRQQHLSKMAEGGEEGSTSRPSQLVPTIRKVLKNVSDEITDEELTKLIFLVSDHLPKGQTQKMNCLKLIGALEERQLIDTKCNDMNYLLDLLHQLPRIDLVKKLTSTLQLSDGFQQITKTKVEILEVDTEPRAPPSSSSKRAVTTTSEFHMRSMTVPNHKQPVDGGFLQDPDLLNSTFNEYDETVQQLEVVTKEKEDALMQLKLSEASKAVLQSKVNNLEMEVSVAKDDQNNLICERNNALAAKSELSYKETEIKKELSEVKRTKLLLEKSLTKLHNEVEQKDEELKKLHEQLEESQNTVKKQDKEIVTLKSKLEEVSSEKKIFEETLREHNKVEVENGGITCKRCGLVYVKSNNPADACSYHTGKYDMAGSIRRRQEWSCCKSPNMNAVGCKKKKHLSIDYAFSPGIADETFFRTDRLGTM